MRDGLNANGPGKPESDRLDSWKEIAAHLDRGVRTVQRWEKDLELPIHRLGDSQSGSVFAFRSEIDAWLTRNRGEVGVHSDGDAKARAQPSFWVGRRSLPFLGTLAVLLAVTLWNLESTESVRPDQIILRRAFEIGLAYQRVSPDGLRIAYGDPETGQIVIIQQGGSKEPVRLLEPGQSVGGFAWSPDNRRIALACGSEDPPEGRRRRVEVLDVDSGERRVLWEGLARETPVPQDWTPDGRTIIATIEQPDRRVALVSLSPEDRDLTRISDGLPHLDDVTVSPDGRLVAFSACPGEGHCDIFTASLSDGQPIQLTDDEAQDWSPVWLAEGSTLLFLSKRLGTHGDLWAMRIDPSSGHDVGRPFLVRELERSVYGRMTLTSQGELFFGWQPRQPRVLLLDVDRETGTPKGEAYSPLPSGTAGPLWIDRGRRLAYHQGAPWGPLRYYDLTTARDDQVGIPGHPRAALLTPSQDGESIAFYEAAEPGQAAIWVYESGVAQARVVQKLGGVLNPPIGWSSDDSTLLYTVTTKRDRVMQEIRVAAVSAGSTWLVARTTGRPPFAAWSPDDEQVAFTDGDCIFTVPSGPQEANPAAPRRITCAVSSDWTDPVKGVGPMGQLAWSADGKKIVWIVNNPMRNRVEMHVVDAASGSALVGWEGESGYESWPFRPTWAPHADQIAFEVNYKRRYEIWALSGFLRPLTGE